MLRGPSTSGVIPRGDLVPQVYSHQFYSSPRGTTNFRHFETQRLGGGNQTSQHIQTNRLASQPNNPAGSHLASTDITQSNGPLTRSLKNGGTASALRNNTFAFAKSRDAGLQALAGRTFKGQLAERNERFFDHDWFWRNRRPIIVIGWFGPVFWPFAYWDFIDYTFWPFAYDVFWLYAYDDLYLGLFGPYAYEGPYYSDPRPSPATRRRAATNPAVTAAEVCRDQVSALTAWPIEQIAQTVQPDATQQAALDELKDATSKSLADLQSACPNDLPSTPTGRLAAMRMRVEAMLQAVAEVQPALEHFYDLLSDEQKARFNPITPEAKSSASSRAGNRSPDLAQVCTGQVAKPTGMPSARIARALNPNQAQKAALQALDDATVKAADYLKANCSAEEALTPPGRVAAMQQRLNAMLEAIKIVQPALEDFYGSLTDEQKARFNQLSEAQS
ncbi:MAG TPA: Spy/CpxP family protein refolding chaperone [Xanthobacteraceae bacterium]|nr:Spy/CpxP family protein refolding chaperone [Xanthobacteraceae bacterium]